jgi:hypothetical protein
MPLPLYSLGNTRGTHLMGAWVELRAGLEADMKGDFVTFPALELETLCGPT